MKPVHRIQIRYRLVGTLAALLALLPASAPAAVTDLYPEAKSFFPQADRFGDLQGDPPAAPVFHGERLVGFVFQSYDVVRIPAYSGKPINTLIGLDRKGRITGIRIVQHEEPILVIGISDRDLQQFIDQYVGRSAFDKVRIGAYDRPGYVGVDAISGATITTMVENATIMRSARRIARSRGLPLAENRATITPASPRPSNTVTTTAAADTDQEPIWVDLWQQRRFRIVVLCTGLVVLAAILVFQDWLARQPTLLLYLREGFLIYTVVFIGWYALAQLSVVNVLTFVHAIMHDFRWETFLTDPMLFILWAFVAATIVLWGRGVYCGWLCPYGAMQELVYQAAKRLRIPSYELPEVVHERLWAVKYIILLALFGLSLQSLPDAQRFAEVEPFKTAVTMHFDRQWPFVAYAAGLLLVSAVNRKFFCKYLCPLGAALTFPARFRIFDWLRRRKECGRPCQICANECEVRAIRPTGEINANECHYCLDCQVTYWNAHRCPPLVERRRRHERGRRARTTAKSIETT